TERPPRPLPRHRPARDTTRVRTAHARRRRTRGAGIRPGLRRRTRGSDRTRPRRLHRLSRRLGPRVPGTGTEHDSRAGLRTRLRGGCHAHSTVRRFGTTRRARRPHGSARTASGSGTPTIGRCGRHGPGGTHATVAPRPRHRRHDATSRSHPGDADALRLNSPRGAAARPRDIRRQRSLRRREPDRAERTRGRHRTHRNGVDREFRWLRPRIRIPLRRIPTTHRSPPHRAAYPRSRRVRRTRWTLQRDLPTLVAWWLAT